MSVRLFLPQTQLDEWLQAGAVELSPAGIRLVDEGIECALEGACHFEAILEGEDDLGLVSKVKTERALKELGAELWGDSVICGDLAYQVRQGFLVVPSGATHARAAGREETRPTSALPPSR